MQYALQGARTQRLFFRKLALSDFDSWLPFHQDPKTSQFWEGPPQDPRTACKALFNATFKRYDHDQGGLHALVSKKENNLIGLCGLLEHQIDGHKEIEIGYSVLPAYWRLGYATEAALKCKQIALEKIGCGSVICIVHVDNLASQKVAGNLGMKREKRMRYKNNPVYIYRINRHI